MSGIIRLLGRDDAAAVAAIYSPAVTESATSFELSPPDATVMASRIESTLVRTPWIGCEDEGRVIGYAYAGTFRERPAYQWSVEVSAYIGADARRRGVARALYTSLFAILVLQGFRTAFAGITLPNEASVGLHRSMGFTEIGVFHAAGYKNDEWHDVIWLEHALAPRILDPPPPIFLPALMASSALQDALDSGLGGLV